MRSDSVPKQMHASGDRSDIICLIDERQKEIPLAAHGAELHREKQISGMGPKSYRVRFAFLSNK